MGYIGVKPAGISSASQVETNLLDVDNITIDGNTISSTDTNGDITLDPNGTGDTIVASGNVGIGTNAPTTYGDSNTKLAVVTPTSNANDVNIRFGTNDVKGIIFVNDVSGDGVGFGTTTNDHVQFNTNNTERMRINASGDVQLGTTTNHGDNNQGGVTFQAATFDRMIMNIGHTDGSSRPVVRFYGNASTSYSGDIRVDGSSTSYNTSSDHRLKENVADMTGAIDRVKALAPKRFNFIADDSVTVDGFLAHEAQTVVPEAVHGTHNEVDDDGNAVMQGIDQSKLVPLLTGALQEAIAKIETLETQRADLETRLTALENA